MTAESAYLTALSINVGATPGAIAFGITTGVLAGLTAMTVPVAYREGVHS